MRGVLPSRGALCGLWGEEAGSVGASEVVGDSRASRASVSGAVSASEGTGVVDVAGDCRGVEGVTVGRGSSLRSGVTATGEGWASCEGASLDGETSPLPRVRGAF